MRVVLLSFLILLGEITNAQNFVDLANLYWRTSPANGVENSTDQVNFNSWNLDIKAPVVLSGKTVFIAGIDLSHNRITNTTAGIDYLFSSAALQLGVEKKWERFKMLALVMPKLSSTFTGGIDGKDFQFGGLVLNNLRRNDHFDWRFGAYVNSELFSIMVVPLLGFNWKINERWRWKMLAPVNLEISRIMSSRWIAGLLFIGVNGSYRMRGQLNPNNQFPGSYQPYLDKADNNAWLYSDIYLTKNLVFNLKIGHSVLRKYRFYDETDKLTLKLGPVNIGNDREVSIPLMKNGWSFETRLIFRMPVKN